MADAPTPDLDARMQAEGIVRNHDKICQGVWDDTAPYCSCAPEGTPLCEACSVLTATIAGILSRAEHAEADLIALRAELHAVDAVLGRRPAVATEPTRASAVEKACFVAGQQSDRANKLEHALAAAVAAKDAAEGRLTAQEAELAHYVWLCGVVDCVRCAEFEKRAKDLASAAPTTEPGR